MKANPGGHIPPKDVIGRDSLIERLWTILDRQGLVLTAERRIGKTCVINKMEAEAGEKRLPFKRDLERVHSTREFVELVLTDVYSFLTTRGKTMRRAQQLLSKVEGTASPGGIKLPQRMSLDWKALLAAAMENLVEHQDRQVVFFWDELPLMLQNIKARESEQAAMELLDTLRALRQTFPPLRMVFTGSIGLHRVLTSLRDVGYANAPVNDMQIEDVPPLDEGAGTELARRLLAGENVATDELDGAARTIAEAVDRIPYYIHHVVDQMVKRGTPASVDTVRDTVNQLLTDPQDPWDMRHFRARIDTYYDKADHPIIFGLLDALATSAEPLAFDDLFNRLKAAVPTDDRERTLNLTTFLDRDHYVIRATTGAYRFRFPLIQRWWRMHRGLAR